MSATEKQMNSAAKEMQKLEKAGRTTSSAYKEAKGTFEAASAELATYKTKTDQNNKSISENNNKQKELIQTMKLSDMTMNQLKRRHSDLAKELKSTSKAANPEAYARLEKELKATGSQMSKLGNNTKSLGSRLNTMWSVVFANFLSKGISLLIKGFKDAARTIIEFQKANSDLAAVLGTTRDKIKDLTDNALQLGKQQNTQHRRLLPCKQNLLNWVLTKTKF